MSVPMTIIVGLLLAGIVVPVMMLMAPESLRGEWIAVAGAAVSIAAVFVLRRRRSAGR